LRLSRAIRGKWRIPDGKVGARSVVMFRAPKVVAPAYDPKVVAPAYGN
jgi:hypothetical protein